MLFLVEALALMLFAELYLHQHSDSNRGLNSEHPDVAKQSKTLLAVRFFKFKIYIYEKVCSDPLGGVGGVNSKRTKFF
jgi:hypothetical protein